ncbi:MAG: Na+/H+ antiporter [Nitrospiraceae bacterium]|nr:Na+/H+ antiporter [Nitrospiraceae bacterium]
MENLHQLEIIIMLLIAVLALSTVARAMLIPYPILLVIGGLLLSLIPGLPMIRLDPDLVFLVFLPPILWSAAYFTSLRDFRANLRPISLLAVGLVLATTAGVAAVAHAVFPGMSWAAAVVLGAIVSPPDAVAATAVARRLNIPRRVITVLEGESLVNDATALVLYRSAVAAVVSGTFVLSETLIDFLFAAIVGVLIGLAVGMVTRWAVHSTDDSFSEIVVTLLAPYAAWVLAEQAHASAVLACVAGGLYLRQYFSAVAPATRIQGRAVWDVIVFALNGLIFILIGLQLGTLREAVSSEHAGALVLNGAMISVTAIVVRLIWVPTIAYVSRWLIPSLRVRDPTPPRSHLFLVAWTGMRGIVSLAAAMALPLATVDGTAFPFRAEIILMTFAVIFSTLVLQGLSLAPLIRALKLENDQTLEKEETQAREHAATAALERLDTLEKESWSIQDQVHRLRDHYARRVKRFSFPDKIDPECSAETAAAFRRLRYETLTAERLAAVSLRDQGIISDEVLHRIENELDVESLRIGVGEQRIAPACNGGQRPMAISPGYDTTMEKENP